MAGSTARGLDRHVVGKIQSSGGQVTHTHIGNSHEHYRCHEVYIPTTKSNQVCDTVFFKHKYLTMPTITPDVALLLAADKLVDAIAGVVPKTTVTKDAITQLMEIFRTQALAASDAISAQRVLRKIAATKRNQAETLPAKSQRVENNEIKDIEEACSNEPNLATFELDSTFEPTPRPSPSPIITQEDRDSPPQPTPGTNNED